MPPRNEYLLSCKYFIPFNQFFKYLVNFSNESSLNTKICNNLAQFIAVV